MGVHPPAASRSCDRQSFRKNTVGISGRHKWGEDVARRVVALVPHPEIESWLYLNTEGLAALAGRDGTSPPEAPADGRDGCAGVKDEHPWPNDRHNSELARRLPLIDAIGRSPSLAAFVEDLRAIPGLSEALAATYAAPAE